MTFVDAFGRGGGGGGEGREPATSVHPRDVVAVPAIDAARGGRDPAARGSGRGVAARACSSVLGAWLLLAGGCTIHASPPPSASAPSGSEEPVEPGGCATHVEASHQATLPTFDGGNVALYPGESVCLEYVEEGPVVRLVRLVPSARAAATEKVLSLSLAAKDGGATLTVRHASRQPMRYGARVVVPTPDGKFTFEPADPCPVRPGEPKLETWEHPVEIVVFGRFALSDEACP